MNTPYSLYTNLLVSSLITSVLLLVLLLKYRKNQIAQAIMGVIVVAISTQITMLSAMYSSNATQAIWWHGNIRLAVYALVAPTGFLFAFAFTTPTKEIFRIYQRNLIILPSITIILGLTNDWHHLFFTSYTMQELQGVFIRTQWQPGFWFWIHSIYSYSISAGMVWIVFESSKQKERWFFLRNLLVQTIVFIIILAINVDTFNILPIPGFLLLPIGFGLMSILLIIGIWYFQLLDILPIARETLTRYMSDAVFVVDTSNQVLDVNPEGEKLIDRPASEIIGKNILQFVLQERRTKRAEEILQNDFHGVMPLITQGIDHFFDITVTGIYLQNKTLAARLIVLRDVTELKSIEEALRQSELTARTLLELPTAAIMLLTPDGKVLDCNDTLSQRLRVSRKDLIGKTTWQFLPANIAENRKRHFVESVQSHQMSRWEDNQDGSWIDNLFIPIIDPEGNVSKIICCGYDISSQKQIEEQERQRAALEERQRLARDLHDAVSQTLFSARLTSEMLLRQKSATPPESHWNNIAHIADLVKSALGEMRILLLELRPEGLLTAKLPTLISHLVDAATSRTEAKIQLTTAPKISLPINVKIAFYRIAQEALNNAIKHARCEQIIIELSIQDKAIRIKIEDDGIGIDANNENNGTKMGLSIMHERAGEINANLEINSHPGNGTQIICSWGP